MRDSAIYELYPEVKQIAFGICYDSQKNIITVDEQLIANKIAELQAAEPLRLLRIERNRLLEETDWRFRSDLTPSQAWIEYCQALRDLPETQTPALDENGNLTNVNWPTPPTE